MSSKQHSPIPLQNPPFPTGSGHIIGQSGLHNAVNVHALYRIFRLLSPPEFLIPHTPLNHLLLVTVAHALLQQHCSMSCSLLGPVPLSPQSNTRRHPSAHDPALPSMHMLPQQAPQPAPAPSCLDAFAGPPARMDVLHHTSCPPRTMAHASGINCFWAVRRHWPRPPCLLPAIALQHHNKNRIRMKRLCTRRWGTAPCIRTPRCGAPH